MLLESGNACVFVSGYDYGWPEMKGFKEWEVLMLDPIVRRHGSITIVSPGLAGWPAEKRRNPAIYGRV
ncbi:hypothetical protein CEXT_751671 [Caerostris extrusa]|uniref:Uncharacterized protein n=1 Tax=Caerostris extrusa TaxID=172846 RepID=A0AAV4NR73_CAEEX|nr:hypothetical protein CEXT_751671 [Caerostris extrusa]